MKSICIFAHFNKNNNLEDYVIDYLNSIKELVDEIIFVSTSDIKPYKIDLLNTLVNKIIIKENKGYDFGSWKEGLFFIKNNYENLPKEIILCNDSCYISENLFKKTVTSMRSNKKLDFWGITRNHTFGEHIQSYFIVLNHRVLKDKEFWNFIYKFEHQNRKIDYISKYEYGLTNFLLSKKYIMDTYINLSTLDIFLITFKYKFVKMIKYFLNIIKYKFLNYFSKNKKNEITSRANQYKSNVYTKEKNLYTILRSIIIYFKTFMYWNITHLNSIQLIKMNLAFLKVSKVKETLEEEGIGQLEDICLKNNFNFKNIIKHQDNMKNN